MTTFNSQYVGGATAEMEVVMPDGTTQMRVIERMQTDAAAMVNRAIPRLAGDEDLHWVMGDHRPHIRKTR